MGRLPVLPLGLCPKVSAPRYARKPEPQAPRPAARTPRAGWVLCVALGVLLAACAQPRGLVRLESPRLEWQDDGSALRLSRAIDGSIAYYQRIPPETVFRYGPELYTPAELIASLELFRQEFLTAPDAGTFAQRIEERFLVFESIREDSPNLFTGYYEPELEASETATESLDTPIYALPQDMVKVRLDRFGGSLPPVTLVGRVVDGELVPYYTRREIQGAGALAERAEPIAYVNAVDLFFLQIQGSGVLRFPDGRRVKVGYAASNGHPYRSIGALLVRQEALPLEEVSLQSIRAWLSRNPEQRERILFANPSYVFFHIRDEGPLGNLRVELTPGRSLAADQHLIPAGSLAYVMTDAPLPDAPGSTRAVRRFMLVQDTGGAIRGHGRGDLFWGAGPDAEWIAGHQKHAGRLLLLVARKEFLPASTAGSP